MDGEKQEGSRAGLVGLLASFPSSFFSAGRIAALYLHTLMTTRLVGWSCLGGMGGLEQLVCLTVPSHFLDPHQETVCELTR